MLISFSVKNFKSIKERVTLYMTPASKYHSKSEARSDKIFETGLSSQDKLLKSAVVYGANASGKTSILEAVVVFYKMFTFKKRNRGDIIKYFNPFIFDKKSIQDSLEFEIDFIVDKKRYVYSFGFDKEKICFEKLNFYKENKKQNIFEIEFCDNKFKTKFSKDFFEGDVEKTLNILNNTKNNLFLPLNVNEDGNGFLNSIYDWIKNKIHVANSHNINSTLALLKDKEAEYKDDVVRLMKKADVGIDDFSVREENISKVLNSNGSGPVININQKLQTVFFSHGKNNPLLSIDQESNGTQSLFGLAGLILPVLKNGGVLFFDELERSLHPDLLMYITNWFYDKNINKQNAQIIFSAHNDILLDKEYDLFDRDQVWFTSKTKKEQKTELYSLVELTDVKARGNLAKQYREFKFGARPALQEFYFED